MQKPKKKSRAMKFISRIDSGSTHGYYVRTYKGAGVVDSKLFSDLKIGGKRKALKAAQEHRDKMRRKYRLRPV